MQKPQPIQGCGFFSSVYMGACFRLVALIQFRYAAVAVRVGGLEGRALLPAFPVGVQMFEALVERRGVDRELGKGDRRGQRDVRERRLVAAQQPLASVRQMPVDQRRMRQRLLAAMLAPGLVDRKSTRLNSSHITI